MNLETLVAFLADILKDVSTSIETGGLVNAMDLRRAERLPVLAALHRNLNRPVVLLTDRASHALTIYDELELWAPGVTRLLFPEPNPVFYEKSPWSENTRRDRLIVLSTLVAHKIPNTEISTIAPIIIAPARAVMTRTMTPREFLNATSKIHPGFRESPDAMVRHWISVGYQRMNTVVEPGQFTRRGGILDLWPIAEGYPFRFEFFGDEIESIYTFDPSTQRTIKGEGIDQLMISPAREYLTPFHNQVDSGSEHETFEFDIPILHPDPTSLLDYLPAQTLVLIDDLPALQDAIAEIEEQSLSLRQQAIHDGSITPDFPIPYITWTEIADGLQQRKAVEFGPPSSTLDEHSRIACPSRYFQPGLRFGGRLKPLVDHMLQHVLKGESIWVVSRQQHRLEELWKEATSQTTFNLKGLGEDTSTPNERPLPLMVFIQGSLTEGWSFHSPTGQIVHLLSDGEIFGWRRPESRQRARKIAEDPEGVYGDLQAGDFVVHIDHGIGIFTGLFNRTIDSIEREYLCIEYADEAQLYVPIYQADRLTRYVGPDIRPPTLSRLGSSEWRSVKAHVKESVQEVAEDLLELYAKRSIVMGYPFQPDSPWQQELEASFPYIETKDQARVLVDVKQDMEAPRPMDRLICGDVGYGKTEVALRASFKSVMNGKQVAVLVPTTVLAQQHYDTFRERLAAFPVEVEMLSRFRTPQQQNQILKKLAQGNIDIVIGTHRLLSGDVTFKDLGLLVIDEEQRFGVTHKETLKKMRTEVDVLTLTATPIPRTLYMALTGVRDISTINTPPEERLPVITHVGPYSPELIRRAVLRELERGGQVFFVHNRVHTIEAMHVHLEKLLPEAHISVAHGQMPECELAKRMKDFTNGEVDILLSTSIIESGLDIPNANTLIVDRADTFGLAQLYQLRGRVGRGAQRAYAYFFRHRKRPLTPESRQRLETIAENTELGSGYSIAMRDLEIRGTGDILGIRQSGHVAAVGFHLYTRLLAESVRRLRHTYDIPFLEKTTEFEGDSFVPVSVDLPIPTSIPSDYVPEKNMRLRLYRRLAGFRTLDEVDAIAEEFKDRFGPIPTPVQNLLFQLKIKILAEKAGIVLIHTDNGQLALKYPEDKVPDGLPSLDSYARVGKTAIWLSITRLPNWQELLIKTLNVLLSSDRVINIIQ